jgi:hypothetical protein
VVELVLVTAEDIGTYPSVPAATACALGFVSAGERDSLVAEADARNRAKVADALRRAARLEPADRAALAAAGRRAHAVREACAPAPVAVLVRPAVVAAQGWER